MSENESVIEQNDHIDESKSKRGYKFTEARKLALEKARKIRKENNDVAKRLLEKANYKRKRKSPKYSDNSESSEDPHKDGTNHNRNNEENRHQKKHQEKKNTRE